MQLKGRTPLELFVRLSMVEDEYREKGQELPADSTEIVHG
jgi:hypothetical protein